MRVLLDTNVLIPLEDTGELLNAAVARFANLSAASGWMVLVHPASFQDVKRDKNEARRAIVLSKLKKYPELDHPPDPTPGVLAGCRRRQLGAGRL